MTGETLRLYRDADAAALHVLFRRAVLEGAAGHYSTEELAEWAGPPEPGPGWADRHARYFTLVAEDAEGIAGYMMLRPNGYLDMTYVRPDRRGTGTADRLYRAILAEAQSRGMRRMTVLASRLMERFLTRRGWRVAPELAAELGEVPQNRAMVLDLDPV